jgi:rubrerythrin
MLTSKSITTLESVLDLAVWLEKHGDEFYKKAASGSQDPDIKQLFENLAAEERKHCAIYTDLYEMFTGKSAEGEELLGEYGRFIQLLINEIALTLDFDGVLEPDQLIEKALQFEKNTLLYFSEVKPLFRGKAGALIEAVCNEEKRHIQQLIEHRNRLHE